MTDNAQELDVILERYRLRANMAYSEVEDNFHTAEEFKTLALPKVLAEAKQALLAWHNKEVEKMLDRLESSIDDGKKSHSMAVISDAIKAERAKLKDNPS